jgi:hypothetical protein
MPDTYGTEALSNIETGPAEANAKERPTQNAAIVRCLRAWQRAYKKTYTDPESDYHAKRAGDRAFLRAMPPLSGFENIRDFVACVTYALVVDVLRQKDAEALLISAKIAITALRQQPNTPAQGAA